MNKKAWVVSGFIAFALYYLMGVLSAILMGRMTNIPMNQIIRISILLTIIIGLLGIIFSLIFYKIHKSIPCESFFLKSIIYFFVLNSIFTVIKGLEKILSVDFLLSTAFSFVAALIFVQLFKLLNVFKYFHERD